MKFHKNKLLTAVAAAALTFAVAACSSNGDDDEASLGNGAPPAPGGDAPGGDTGPAAPLSELATAQADAAAAATAAMTASGEAATAAEAAMAAVANLATMQTGATAGGLADEAQTAAGKAMKAYMDAKAASEAAAEAGEVTAAVEARIMAEEAMANAVMYAMTASEKGTAAEAAAMAELMIDGKDKNVGGTSVNADAASSVVTTAIGTASQTVATGRLTAANDPKREGFGQVDGAPFVPAVAATADNTAASAAVAYKQGVAARNLTIGRTLDTSDDMARLMLVTHYAGTKMVRVYNAGDADPRMGSRAGYISLDDGVPTTGTGVGGDMNNVALKSEGNYYPATPVGTGEGELAPAQVVAALAMPKEVFSYVNPNATQNPDDVKTYVVAGTTTTGGGADPEYNYVVVDVIATAAVADGDDDLTVADDSKVRAALPVAIDYKHIHFGVWAALGAAEKSGLQELSDLGIGFVQSIGDGLTGADMPNNGKASYSGSWVAAVQAAEEDGNGVISLKYGAATIGADLTMATIEANLMGLAKLEGAIDTNTFSGTKATVDGDNTYNLDSTGKFTGSFSGGFYGAQAAEAGGIFDFTSKDAVDGAFRGAFGGDRKGL